MSQINSSPKNKHEEAEVEREEEALISLVPDGTASDAVREEVEKVPPGPSSYKERLRDRSRSGSASSRTSLASNASAATRAERRSRRELTYEANRLAAEAAREREQAEESQHQVILVPSGSDDTEEEKAASVREDYSRKRKLTTGKEGAQDETDGTQTKQGRPREPPTTGLYIGRNKAIEKLNQEKREAIALENELALRNMSSGQIFSRMGAELDEAMDEIADDPTADIAHRARECMAEVLKVAKGSRNLQGGYIKILKHAAVMGSASTEVLRTRADINYESEEGDPKWQIRVMRRELEQVKREAQQAKEEAAKAKEEAETDRKSVV